ncbi:MAG: hypothetical protein HRF50_04485 [Phycisphaerae bacterium]|jgi:hypothetical protein
MSAVVEVADAVAALLSAGGFAEPFDATRTYIAEHAPEDLLDLLVSVVPGPLGIEANDRRSDWFDCTAVVIVEQFLADPGDMAAIDGRLALCEEIADKLRATSYLALTTLGQGLLKDVEIDPPYDFERLRTEQVFTAAIAATYRVAKTR